MAKNNWQIAAVAAAHGMTVEAWLTHCDRVEAREKQTRRAEQQMRSVPQYRNAA